jgi:hypothetical protein
MVYFCEGTDPEKLKWLETINMAGTVLTKQELRNAVYTAAGFLTQNGIRVVRKLQFSNNFRLKNAKCVAFCKTWAATNRVSEQV